MSYLVTLYRRPKEFCSNKHSPARTIITSIRKVMYFLLNVSYSIIPIDNNFRIKRPRKMIKSVFNFLVQKSGVVRPAVVISTLKIERSLNITFFVMP